MPNSSQLKLRALKQAVRRNPDRFSEDFMFELTAEEIQHLVSQTVILGLGNLGGATPMAFTEQGVAMLSSVLRGERAVKVNVATDMIVKTIELLEAEGFASSTFEWSVNFKGSSKVSLQLNTEDFYRDFASRSVPADVHGILLRVASLQDTLAGKIKAWSATERRQSKRIKDLGDISRLVESYPELWGDLPPDLQTQIDRPPELS